MNKCLILLTYLYPFDKSEPFLENEVKYLDKFDHIYVVPCSLKKKCKQTRDLPNDKYEILDMSFDEPLFLSLLKWVLWSIYSFFTVPFWSDIGYIIKSKKKILKRTISLIKFIAYAERKYRKAAGLLKKQGIDKYDEIVIYSYWFHNFAYIGIKLKKRFKGKKPVKVISRAHRYDIYDYSNNINYLPLRKFLLKNLNNVYPISSDGIEYLKSRYPEYSRKVKLQRLGTNDHGIKLIKKDSPLRIVSCSNLIPVKRVHLLIEALSLIDDIPVCWTHLGSGPLQQDLEKLAREKLKSNITAEFKGYMPNVKVLEFYKNTPVHLFINTSENEGVPVSIMEAISFGIPAIATDVGGNKEIIENNVNGYLLKKDFEAGELAELIRKFANMPEDKYAKLCRNARSLWERKYNAEKNYMQFVKLIYKAV